MAKKHPIRIDRITALAIRDPDVAPRSAHVHGGGHAMEAVLRVEGDSFVSQAIVIATDVLQAALDQIRSEL